MAIEIGARRYEQRFFSDDIKTEQKIRISHGPSGSMVSDGLYLADDSADPTSSTLLSSGSLLTGSITNGVIYNNSTNYSVGIDQGKAYNTSMIILIDEGSAGYGISRSGSIGDSGTLYQSTDNSTWTLVQNYQPLTRVVASGSSVDNPNAPMMITIACNTTQRYLKLYMDKGPLRSAEGKALYLSAMSTYQETPLTWSSGSYGKEISVTVPSDQVKAITHLPLRSYRHSPINSEIQFQCTGYLINDAISGSIDFGLGIQSGSIANGTASIPLLPRYGPGTIVSGSLDLSSIDLVNGQTYDFFTSLTAYNVSGSVGGTGASAKISNVIVPNVMDLTQFGGSGSAGDIYVNSGGTSPSHPDGYLYWHVGGDDQGTYIKYDAEEQTFEIPTALQTRELTVTVDPFGFSDPTINFEGSGDDGSIVYDLVSDQFVLDQPLDMGTNQIHNVVDPSSLQDAATKNYVDGNASVGTLDGVCNNGNTTDQDITAANLKSNADLYLNMDNSDDNVYIYFGKSPAGAESLVYNKTVGYFLLSDHLHIMGDAYVNTNIYANFNGPNGDAFMFFYDENNPERRHIKWDTTASQFEMNADLSLGANKLRFNDPDAYWQFASGVMKTGKGVWAGGTILGDDNAALNFSGPNGNSFLYFFNGGSATGAYLAWDNAGQQHSFTHKVIIQAGGKYLQGGNDHSLNDIDVANTMGLYGVQNSAVGAIKFGSAGGTVIGAASNSIRISNADATNYTEIKADGEINLYGTARVKKHIDIGAVDWHRGASAPTEVDIGVFHTLEFGSAGTDEIHACIVCPHDFAAGTSIDVTIYWTYTGAQDNGTVRWELEYKNIATGEAVAGAGTVIASSDPGNHATGDLVQTQLTASITGAAVNDIIGLFLSRNSGSDTLSTGANLIDVHFEYVSDRLGEST